MVIVVAVPSRIALGPFGAVASGELIVGAAVATNTSVTTPEEPPLVFTTVAVWAPSVSVVAAGREIVPKMAFGVTSVTVAVPSESVTVAPAKKPDPTSVNGTPAEPMAMDVGTLTSVTSSLNTEVLFR